MRILKHLLLGLLILWGLLALTVRIATPLIADYRESVAAWAGDRLGTPVRIGRIGLRWYGLRPLLELHDVAIGDSDRQLRVDGVSVDVTPTRLATGGLADALRVTVDGLQVTAVREADGRLHIEGIGPFDPGAATGSRQPLLPRRLHLTNTRVVWVDHRVDMPPLPIEDVTVVMAHNGGRLRLYAGLQTPAGSAELNARLRGSLSGTEWQGDTYLKLERLDVARLFAAYMPARYGLHSMAVDLEAWTHWDQATPVSAQGRVALNDLDLRPTAADTGALQVPHAAAGFDFRRDATGGRVGIGDLHLTVGARTWPTGNLALAWTSAPDGATQLRGAADYLRIEDLAHILRVRMPWPELAGPLARFKPRGELRDLRFAADFDDATPHWRAQAGFAALGTAACGRVPATANLAGTLHAQQDHAIVQLDARGSTVRFTRLFRDALQLSQLQGRIDLLRERDGWRLHSDALLAVTPHITTRTRVDLRTRPDAAPFLDLQTDFRDGDAGYASRYYPVDVMGEHLVEWLDRSIISGHVIQGTTLVYGELGDFPFEHHHSGTFTVVFDAEDVNLDYREGWPPLEGIGARVRFEGNHLDIVADRGTVFDSRLIEAQAHIRSLHPTSPIEIAGQVEGPLSDDLRILREEALRPRFGHFAEALQGRGQTRLMLDFSLPLKGPGEPTLAGRLDFEGAELALPAWNLNVTDLRGQLGFTLDGLNARAIKGQALGAPVTIDVERRPGGVTRVHTQGRFDVSRVAGQWPSLPLQPADGAAGFTIDVDIPSAQAASNVTGILAINSDLEGVRLDLPAPLGKTAAQKRELALRMPLGDTADPGELEYAERLSARFDNTGKRIGVAFGKRATLPPEPGIRITGRIEQFDPGAWWTAMQRFPQTAGSQPPPTSLDLQVDRLSVAPLDIADMHVEAAYAAGYWHGQIESERLAGSFGGALPLTAAPLRVTLSRLALDLPHDDEAPLDAGPPDPSTGTDPGTLPELDVEIAGLTLNDADLGTLRLHARRSGSGLEVDEFGLHDGQLELTSSAIWQRGEQGIHSEWRGDVDTAALGDLLVDLGYSRQIEDAAAQIAFRLRWPGSPAQLHRATLEGALELDIGAGRLVELDPGVTRVVGLLNLNALTRRLRLDFSDFYKKGYSFDSIKGAFHFANGTAQTDDLTVRGPTGRIEVNGSADLLAETLDQKVTVIPNLDATLPIAGTIAGGPVAGVAVLVAQRLMTKQVDQIYRFEYALSGPWAQPEVRQLDSGGTLSKLLQPFKRESPDAPPVDPAASDRDAAGAANPPLPPPDGPAAVPADEAPASGAQQPAEPGTLRSLLDRLKRNEGPATDAAIGVP
ncbi:MAG: TIGR02099 family protein [Chromatiaceae bacterium]|nr:TIGR02099 family protein [Chromatiaceae bacterium]MCP5315134.1 TIGR02099 family protein [Chromatiaceae bacterium]